MPGALGLIEKGSCQIPSGYLLRDVTMINIARRDSFHSMPGIFIHKTERGFCRDRRTLNGLREAFGQDQERHLYEIKRAGF